MPSHKALLSTETLSTLCKDSHQSHTLKAPQMKTATTRRTKICRKGCSRREGGWRRNVCQIEGSVPNGATWHPNGSLLGCLESDRGTCPLWAQWTIFAARENPHNTAPLVPDNNKRTAHNAGSLDDSCEAETGRSWNWQYLEVDDWWWNYFRCLHRLSVVLEENLHSSPLLYS